MTADARRGRKDLDCTADATAFQKAFGAELRELVLSVRPGITDPASLAHFDEFADIINLGQALVTAGMLTEYQLDRIIAGSTHGLLLGNYRVLDRLGSGSMGVVFLAEHLLLKRRVAIKVLPVDETLHPALLTRFYSEMRVLADLHHPNIVMAALAVTTPQRPEGAPAHPAAVSEVDEPLSLCVPRRTGDAYRPDNGGAAAGVLPMPPASARTLH